MPKYVLLGNWTERGVTAANETLQRSERAREIAERLGGRFEQLLWTVGRYDVVAVLDLPSDEAYTTFALQVAAAGALRTEGLRAFTAEEMGSILGNLG